MAYPAYRPFQAPHRARLPERLVQTGVLAALVGTLVPIAFIDRLLGRSPRKRQPTLTSVLERQ